MRDFLQENAILSTELASSRAVPEYVWGALGLDGELA
jgi:hypothetical protein